MTAGRTAVVRLSYRTLIAACAALFLTACGKKNDPPATGESTKDSIGAAKEDAPATAEKAGPDAVKAEPDEQPSAPGALATRLTFSAAQVQHGGVRWAPVTMGTTAGRATIPGEVIPNEDRTVRLGAPGRGRVVYVRVQPGQRVSSGQVLVVLQSPEAGVAQSDVTKAAAELTSWKSRAQYADAARARAERLLALKAIPQQDYERSIVDDEEAHASLAQARAELTRATTTANQLGAGNASLSGEFVIRSTMNGVVLARTAVAGAVVDAGAPLAVITDPSSLWLAINASEQFASLIRPGGNVRFTVPAYPTETFTATINAVGAGLDPETRTLAARGLVNNAGGKLKPEMLASVVVEGGTTVPAVLVPEDAVQPLDGKPNVFLARPDGKGGVLIERREVEVGSRSGGRIAVTKGLAAGDVIVTVGGFAVKAEFQKATIPKDVD
jgi:cobalt-zinc-cadmium efflux system membrane fusion protein